MANRIGRGNMGKLRQKFRDIKRAEIKKLKKLEIYKSEDAPQIIFDRINNAGYKRQRKNERRLREG